MNTVPLNLLLADDDVDDCMFFKEALEELPVNSVLNTVHDGDQLMRLLTANSTILPDILFLDLNMPRKTGFECLSEIKLNENLKALSVIIYSTSLNSDVVNRVYNTGAQLYIRKPGEFSKLKKVILEALSIASKQPKKPSIENFVVQV